MLRSRMLYRAGNGRRFEAAIDLAKAAVQSVAFAVPYLPRSTVP